MKSSPPSDDLPVESEQDAFIRLASRYLDNVASGEELAKLQCEIASDADKLQLFVRLNIQFALLHETIGGVHGAMADELWPAEGDLSLLDDAPLWPAVASHSPLTTALSRFSGWPVAYLVATVLCGIGLLVRALVYVPQSTPLRIVEHSPSGMKARPASPAQIQFIGRITGMVDCKWFDPHTAVPGPVAVPLGREYALASGLLAITYNTGAKVILQGPCTYEVESPTGGYLSLGKLTARVESQAS